MKRDNSQKTSILIVDDEEVVRLSHARVLSNSWCRVKTAGNGPEALRALERESFDVVLLDLRMPEMSGLEVLRLIKERWPESEVVIITGYASIDTAKEAVRLGAYDYLAKPLDPDQVITATHGAVRQKRWTMHLEPPDTMARPGTSRPEARLLSN